MWKIGIHNGYWLGSGYEDEFRALEATKKAGADIYEMNTGSILRFSDDQLKQFRKAAENLGISLTVNGGYSADNDIGSDDVETRARGVDFARKVIHGMRLLGATTWSGLTYGAWKRLPKPSTCFTSEDKVRIKRITVKELKKIGAIAQDNGVKVLFEVVNRFEQFLLNTADEAFELVREVGMPSFGILLDTYHMNIEENSMVDAIKKAGKAGLLGEIHLGESNRRLPGLGPSNFHWEEIFQSIKDSGYKGALVLEPYVVQGLPISSRICVWRDLSDSARPEGFIDNARKSIGFIRSFEMK